ncbi:activator of HSP90 ATPase [Geomonas limicola]|uniref:Activator of HSP90 ATPase n=1 Tax=Geomonas limicola TaxID=2740186 RepID=A0A6V8NDP9_9BACT|nr:SRPBCC family protein [Geomonas limicola]GFO70570.1 activator of HSP90 ATPase [Geomonas limicola]
MKTQDFVYATYIKSTPEKVWKAIISPEFTRQYWGEELISDWQPGSPWHSVRVGTGTQGIFGEVLESEPPRKLVMTWTQVDDKEDDSCLTFAIEAVGEMVRLTVTHGKFKDGSTMASRVSEGWPRVLSSLKTLLETGTALDTWAECERTCGKGK